MSMLKSLKKDNKDMGRFCLNTGTHFDIATGRYIPGKNGMILNGGLNVTNAVVGREQTFKSTIALGYLMKAVINYISSEGIVYDTEYSIAGIERLKEIANNSNVPIDDRLSLYDKTDYDMDGIFKLIKEIANEKLARKKEFIAETPFLNPVTGKLFKAFIPTIIAIDSWTLMQSAAEIEIYEKGIDNKKTNTSYMVDGNKKSQMMRQLPLICSQAGIYLIMTAHVGNSIRIDPFAPIQKDLPHMRASDKIKGVGSQFNFLVSNLIETRGVTVLKDSNKKCQYPLETGSSDVELQEVNAVVCRCKNNQSGSIIRHVVSQQYGIQDNLDYYNMMREDKSPAIEGTVHQKIPLVDKSFTRKNIRSMLRDNYEFNRAINILGQFHYIQNNWNVPEFRSIGIMKFAEILMKSSKPSISDVLNSTGVWTFNNVKSDRKYMSIFDIFNLIMKNK